MLRAWCIVIGAWLCVPLLAGCGPIMRDLQYSNVRSGLFPMKMDLSVGKGRIDAGKLIKEQAYEGVVEREDVTVHFPAGMSSLAREVSSAFGGAQEEIRMRTGVTWAFKLDLYLVEVNDTSPGFKLQFSIRKDRRLRLPILIHDREVLPQWSRGIGHELTEASMLAPSSRGELILGDYCVWGSGLVNETRWFRDGVAEYAGDILNEHLFGERYQTPPWIYSDLARVRESLLDWDNCEGEIGPDTYYNASNALVRMIEARSGEDAVARIMRAASEGRYINGSALRRAVRKVTGLDLKEFLCAYQVTWLGMDLKDSSPGLIVGKGNRVTVARVYPGTPAARWKLRSGDVILSADGKPVVSGAWLVHYVAAHQPRDRIVIEFERAGERFSYRMVTAARPSEGS